jgi:hypothetical protein
MTPTRTTALECVVAQVAGLAEDRESRIWFGWIVIEMTGCKDHAVEAVALAHRERTAQRSTSSAAPASGPFGVLRYFGPPGWILCALKGHAGSRHDDSRGELATGPMPVIRAPSISDDEGTAIAQITDIEEGDPT